MGQTPDGEAGEPVRVEKVHEDGTSVTTYQATRGAELCPSGWFVIESPWINRSIIAHGLHFGTGDLLVEYFSTSEWFNVFRVQAPTGEIRGWYANVTYPTRVQVQDSGGAIVVWQDLYLDVIKLAGGPVIVCDEDELGASGLASRDPDLHIRIVETAGQMVALAESGSFPFHDPSSY